ncbi:PQQ-dependent sugar dehydrogenase [bacterium]|nr:PQQ-dependent sugar dehydrogenase [bacterium]
MKFVVTTLLLLFSIYTLSAPAKVYTAGGEKFQFEILVQQKDVVWGFDFLNNDQMIFTERSGALRILNLKSKSMIEVKNAPQVWANGQGGLLDVRVHPTDKSKIYLSYSEPVKDEATTALGFGTLKENSLSGFKKIFSGYESNDNNIHFGSRIEFDGLGNILLTMGDRNERKLAQDLNYHNGKILRLKEDGNIPADNPFVKNKDVKPEIWSYGHRNPQGLVRNAKTGELWSAEMGPKGGDELNLIVPGKNYGWPVITYGREYYGPKIGKESSAGMEQPITYWVPSISPSALTIYTGNVFPKWNGNIFIGTLSGMHLRRLKMDGPRVVEQEEMLKDFDLRIRNVRTGPEGALYISTDDGKIARLTSVK